MLFFLNMNLIKKKKKRINLLNKNFSLILWNFSFTIKKKKKKKKKKFFINSMLLLIIKTNNLKKNILFYEILKYEIKL